MAIEISDISRLNPILAGYFPKRTARRPEWLEAAGVEEICSVSDCISPSPDGWIEHWLHNPLGLYPDEEIARRIAGEGEPGFDIYAYRILDVAFPPGGPPRELTAEEERAFAAAGDCTPMGAPFERLGWDAVGTWLGIGQSVGFDCSPLTCNGMAAQIATNRYGLLDTLEQAVPVAIRFAREQPEPGTYFLVEVWRKRRSDGAAP